MRGAGCRRVHCDMDRAAALLERGSVPGCGRPLRGVLVTDGDGAGAQEAVERAAVTRERWAEAGVAPHVTPDAGVGSRSRRQVAHTIRDQARRSGRCREAAMAAWAEAPEPEAPEPDADPRLGSREVPGDVAGHEQDAVLALGMCRRCSGLLCEMEAAVDDCLPPTDEAVEAAVAAFKERVPRERRHRGCAGCGTVVARDDLSVRDVGSMSSLAMDGQRLEEHVGLSAAGKGTRHAVLVDGAGWFAVAPDLCFTTGDGTLRGWFCEPCVANKARHSTFLTFDYGVPCAGLAELSVLNKLALSRVLTHAVIVKLVTTKAGGMQGLRSHCFAVPHDGCDVVAGLLNTAARDAMSVVFIGRDPAAWLVVRRRHCCHVGASRALLVELCVLCTARAVVRRVCSESMA